MCIRDRVWPTARSSSSPVSAHYRDTFPLKSYTHCVPKNCLDFMMSITKSLFFGDLLASIFFRETASRTGDTRWMLLLLLHFSTGKHLNCDWHMRQWTIGHWQTLSSEELATSDTTGHVWNSFCLHHEFSFIYYKLCVLEFIQSKSILLSCAKILLYH